MDKSNTNKNVIVSVLLVMIALLFGITNFTRNKNYNNLDEIKVIYNEHPEMFAMYIQNQDGTYTKAGSGVTNFPNPSNYILNIERSLCYDNDGNIVTSALGYVNHEVTVQTSTTLFCNLYFDTHEERIDILINVANYNSLPGYSNTITSSDGTGRWDSLYNRMIISSISKTNEASFIITSTADNNSYTSLKTTVETTGTSGNGSIVNEGTAGYRYEGKNPNNYVWFNNEMWRIIGSIPVCLTSGCGNSATRLVKIIRNSSIGWLAYDGKDNDSNTSDWGSNTLYKLLNGCYYGKKNVTDNDLNNSSTPCSSYCFGYRDISVSLCNYQRIGISSNVNDYYGSMIKNVYWNTGVTDYDVYDASAVYANEKLLQTVQGKIGLMALSDYGYAASYGRDYLKNYDGQNYTGSNWLFGKAEDNTMIKNPGANDYRVINYIIDTGASYSGHSYIGHDVRPTLYLDDSVYIISGNGTESNPYKLGM